MRTGQWATLIDDRLWGNFLSDLDLWWMVRPALENPRSWRTRRADRIVPRSGKPLRMLQVSRAGSGLAVTRTENQMRVLRPVLEAIEAGFDSRPLLVTPRQYLAHMASPKTEAARVTAQGVAVLKRLDHSDRIPRWTNIVAKANLTRMAARQIPLEEFDWLLISTQHDPHVRAVVARAREIGLPVVYIPHAPLASNPQYLDLPVDFAGVRGDLEAEYYARFSDGAASGIVPIGNPATGFMDRALAPIGPEFPVVLAVSPFHLEILQRIIEVVELSGLKDVVVAPHPGSNRKQLSRLVPRDWRIAPPSIRTSQLLSDGVRALIQHSSGVAWEALAMGIPTADIRLGEPRPNYPFLDNAAAIPALRSPQEVRQFVERAAHVRLQDREGLREYARSWCACDGPSSVSMALELLDRARHEGARATPIIDGWAPDGPASVMSEIAPAL